MKVAIIGAGPSGLVTLKYLKSAPSYFPIEPIEVRVFEAGTIAFDDDLKDASTQPIEMDVEMGMSP